MSRAVRSGIAALFHDYRQYAGARLWVALVLMVLGAFAEGFSLLMIVPLTSIAIGAEVQLPERFAGLLRGLSTDQRFIASLALFVGAMAARSVLLYSRDILLARLQAGYEASLRLRAAATLAHRGWSFAGRIGQARMQSLLLVDVPRAAQAIGYLQNSAVSAVMLLIQATLTAILSPVLTLIALAIFALSGLLSVGVARRSARTGKAIVWGFGESASSSFRLHAGLKAALAQGSVPQFLGEYAESLERLKAQFVRYAYGLATARQTAGLGAAVAAAVLLLVGVRLLELPFPVLIASLVLFGRMSAPALYLQQSTQQIAALAPAFNAIEDCLGEIQPPPAPATVSAPLDWKELRLDSACYEHQVGLGLHGATLRLVRGEWIGIGGASGAGKTTLVDLVAGLLSPRTGEVTVDGQALDGRTLEGWRAGLAYVGQEGTVFNDSVRGNLLAEGAKANDQLLWQTLELVGLADRVRAFPRGLEESVGDRGSQLSGGERQRLVLARALLRQPSLLILDEATAALDPDSEAELLRRLRALKPRPAAILVAHRPTTLAHCDSAVTIQHGTVEKSGDQSGLADEVP